MKKKKTLMVSPFLKPLNPNSSFTHLLAHFTNHLKHHKFPSPLTRSMSSASSSQQCIFQLRPNPLSGDSEWVVIHEHDQEQSPQQPLLAATSYLDMLNDSTRNKAFNQAIHKTITKPCHVLDIGSGTGLLSMMAARAMRLGDMTAGSGTEGSVTACESYLPMVKLMRKVLRANNMERHIRIFNKRSDEVQVGVDIPSRADVLVSEILDSELLGEGLIPTLQHAHENLLVENPLTVPYRATVFGQLVESTYLRKLHNLYNTESEALDGIKLVPKGMDNVLSVKRQQYAMHCDAITEEVKLLSEPFKIFDFEFSKRPESSRDTELCIKAVNDGTAHAIISWWMLQLDSEATIFYSTAPNWINVSTIETELMENLLGAQHWCDHWKQCVWFIPKDGLPVHKNHEVYLHATHTATSITYEVKTSPQKMDFEQYNPCTEDSQVFLSPERIAIYGDSSWRGLMLKAIKNAVQHKDSPLCVVADDSIFLTVAVASLSKTSHLIALFPNLRQKGFKYLHLVSSANGFSMDRVELTTLKNLMLSMCNTHQRKIDFLIGEPFYSGVENMLPWQSLRFWKERTLLDPILSEDAQIFPCKGILRACAMSLPDLWRSRCSLQEIEGFSHSVANSTLGACGGLPEGEESPWLAFPIWQCGDIKMLSEVSTVMEFDLMKPMTACSGNVKIEFTESGICHGIVMWIDWVLDAENSIVYSTGPDKRHWKQGVKLLERPAVVRSRKSAGNAGICSAKIDTSLDPSSGDLSIIHSFS